MSEVWVNPVARTQAATSPRSVSPSQGVLAPSSLLEESWGRGGGPLAWTLQPACYVTPLFCPEGPPHPTLTLRSFPDPGSCFGAGWTPSMPGLKNHKQMGSRPGPDLVQAGRADLEAQAPQAEGLQLCPIAASSGPHSLFACL